MAERMDAPAGWIDGHRQCQARSLRLPCSVAGTTCGNDLRLSIHAWATTCVGTYRFRAVWVSLPRTWSFAP
ncbi:hypothetical protein FHY13_003449 [Xanthomonas arboricola]|nr:hypothetical protein [Xanthomonas euroxanthea]